jgi:hypothetical protein
MSDVFSDIQRWIIQGVPQRYRWGEIGFQHYDYDVRTTFPHQCSGIGNHGKGRGVQRRKLQRWSSRFHHAQEGSYGGGQCWRSEVQVHYQVRLHFKLYYSRLGGELNFVEM